MFMYNDFLKFNFVFFNEKKIKIKKKRIKRTE